MESSDRDRLVATLKALDRWSPETYADAILAACEVKWREPEYTEREKVARGLCAAWNAAEPAIRGDWEGETTENKNGFRGAADYALKLRDDAWNAAIEAVLGVARVKYWSDDAENAIRALKREAK